MTSSRLFCYAALLGLALGLLWSIEPTELSRWPQYRAIGLGMPREQAISLVESYSKSRAGCGAYHWESRDSVCRFEDPWRGYVINFDPNTKLVNRRYFYFKPVPKLGIR